MHLFLITFASVFVFCDPAAAAGFGNVTADADGFAPSWVKKPYGRGTYDIVELCVSTLFLAAWSSLHLNIPQAKERTRKMILRLGFWFQFATLIPEWIPHMALSQRLDVGMLLGEIEDGRRSLHEKEAALSNNSPISRLVTPAFESRKPYRLAFGWCAIMGYFTLNISKIPPHVRSLLGKNNTSNGILTLKPLAIIVLNKLGISIHAKNRDIPHNAPSDIFLKVLTLLQVIRFLYTQIRRKIAGLPLSLLEIYILIAVVCGITDYILWWSKPANLSTTKSFDVVLLDKLMPMMLHEGDTSADPTFCISNSSRLYAFSQLDPSLNHQHRFCPECSPDWYASKITISAQDSKATIYTLESKPQQPIIDDSQSSPEADLASQFRKFRSRRISSLKVTGGVAVELACRMSHPTKSDIGMQPISGHHHAEEQAEHHEADTHTPIYSLIELPNDFVTPTIDNFSLFRLSFGRDQQSNRIVRLRIQDVGWNIWIGYALILAYSTINLLIAFIGHTFPTKAEKYMWIIATSQIMLWLLLAGIVELYVSVTAKIRGKRTDPYDWKRPKVKELEVPLWSWKFLGPTAFCVWVLVGRLYLMAGAFIAMRHEKVEVFYTPAPPLS